MFPKIQDFGTLFDLESTWGPEGASDGQVLGCFQPPWGPWGLRLGSNYSFFIWDQFLINTFGSRINPRARRWPWWPSFGRFRPSCGPRWSWMGLNYPFFIGNQLIFLTFCSRIDPRRRRCPRWPGFGLFPASMRSVRVEVGLKLSVFHMGSIPINHFWL